MTVVLLIDRGIIEGENHVPHCQLLSSLESNNER